ALAGDGPAGQPGEDDRLQGFESAVGGSGDDRLTGTAHGDRLAGGDGEDRIDGLAGDDGLDGGRGRDRLRGGAGDDGLDGDAGPNRLSGGPGGDWFTEPLAADHLSCGPGTDALANPAALIRVAPACERLRYAFAGRAVDIGLDPHPRAASPAAVRLRMGCPRFETMDGLCPMRLTGVLELRSAGRPHVLLGSAPQRWTLDGDDRPVHTGATIPLTAAGRRLAGRPRGVEARVRLTLGSLEPMRWVTRVRVG
ncbi:MAG TPA: hypothetical protein VFR97_03930, partial [Capillimicrobium sp.]|nr:hypothetical protein [Capillimicrobium sp.]